MNKTRLNLFAATFLSPMLLIYTALVIVPVFMTLYYSFLDWDGVGRPSFILFENYRELVRDPDYWRIARNNLVLIILALIIQNPLGLVFAYMISRTKTGYRAFRSIYFLPVVVSSAATALMFTLLFNNEVGPITLVLDGLGLAFLKRNWLSDPKIVLYAVALPQVWQFMGVQFILFLAAIQSIPEEIIESAHLDGASAVLILTRIMVPLLWEVVQICIIWTVTGCLRAFDFSWIMTAGGPGIASTYLPVYVFRKAFKEFTFSYSSTIAISILVYSLGFTLIFKKLFAREAVEY